MSERMVAYAIDGDGVLKAWGPMGLAGVHAAVRSSGGGRGLHLGRERDSCYVVKKLVEVTVSETLLDWLILCLAMLVERAGSGAICLGAAQPHDEIYRDDVAATLVELLHEPRIRRQIRTQSGLDADRRGRPGQHSLTQRFPVSVKSESRRGGSINEERASSGLRTRSAEFRYCSWPSG